MSSSSDPSSGYAHASGSKRNPCNEREWRWMSYSLQRPIAIDDMHSDVGDRLLDVCQHNGTDPRFWVEPEERLKAERRSTMPHNPSIADAPYEPVESDAAFSAVLLANLITVTDRPLYGRLGRSDACGDQQEQFFDIRL